jgi:hypothetical protein
MPEKTLLEDAREYWESLDYCGCYSQDIKEILDKATKCLLFTQSDRDGDAGAAMLVTPDGIYTIMESQDYTGHG